MLNKKIILITLAVVIAVFFVYLAGTQLVAAYYFEKGRNAFNGGDFAGAKKLLQRSLSFYSKNPSVYFYFGKISLGIPRPGEALLYPEADYVQASLYFEQSFSFGLKQKDPALYTTALNDAGFSYWMLSEYDKADDKFAEHIHLSPDQAFVARYFLALDYVNRLDKPKEAIEILLPALDSATLEIHRRNLFRVYRLISLLYFYFGDFDNVEKYAKLAIESGGPENKRQEIQTAHVLLAIDYGHQKKFTLSESEIKKANDLVGKAGAYNCFLALAYVAGENYSKAISIAENTNKTASAYVDSDCIKVLAVSYLAQGDKIKAKKYMEEYIKLAEKFLQKDIFVARNITQFADEFPKLR